MLDDDFFIYKLANSDYWCDSYTPSKLVVCHAECDEIRFDMSSLYQKSGATAYEYQSHIEEWTVIPEENLTCKDHNELKNVLTFDGVVTDKQHIEKIKGVI